MIDYRIELADPRAHRFHVTLRVPRAPTALRLSLPVWIPGSYLVREFARHLSALRAEQGGVACRVEALDKSHWLVHGRGHGALRVDYDVYTFDTSVRAAFLDEQRAFFNGSSLCLRVEGFEAGTHRLRLGALPAGWQVATAMAPTGRPREFVGADYRELIDHPVALGPQWTGRFDLRGVPHLLAVGGAWPGFDGDRLLADVRRICDAQTSLWHGGGRPPFDRYVFLLQALDDGYGGLEHRASTALLTARRHLPRIGVAEAGDGYIGLLGLFSHEYFHAWNVTRLKPREFEALDLQAENYTRLLWFFEGFTSYYDDLLLLRAGRIDAPRYLQLLGKTLDTVLATPGRRVQSVAEASFDAWIKYYRQDENSPNALVSYYLKGSLAALALDLLLRSRTHGARSLDDVMRALWQVHGRTGTGVPEGGVERIAESVAGFSLKRFFDLALRSTDELPLARLLARFGIRMVLRPSESGADRGGRAPTRSLAALRGRASFGARTVHDALGAKIANVYSGSAAERAGLSAGDVIVAMDGLRVTASNWEARLDALRPGQRIVVHAFRRDALVARDVTLVPASADTCHLEIDPRASASARRLRARWLADGAAGLRLRRSRAD
jgi:predicted metalloprotease with PDZ domain